MTYSGGGGSAAYHYCNLSLGTSSVTGNFTYADASSEGSMVSASVLMFVLAGFFFNLNLFGGLSNVGAILGPRVRLLFTSSLSLFLPVMSYLFSEAKNTAKELSQSVAVSGGSKPSPDLPFIAGVILTWMLLVELIRKKVDEIAMRGYSGTIHRAGRVVWLGSLVFFNIRSAGRKAVFGVLWVLCATKVVQRIAFTEVGKRSYACGKNTRIINSYMSSITPRPSNNTTALQQSQDDGEAILKQCKYIVDGEEDLNVQATADGYKIKEDTLKFLVTVDKIWDEKELPRAVFTDADHLRRLCLSFALFKLLRRRVEHLPEMSSAETRECRDIIFKGLYKSVEGGDKAAAAAAVFEVMSSEIHFLSEYYHSVVPVVLASPFFFLANYFLLPIVVVCVCLMTVILCGGGDVLYALSSIKKDNFTLSSGIFNTSMCLLLTAHESASAFFATINFSVTFLLCIIYVYEEVWEFFVFLLSNWFAVSLICSYVGKTHRWLNNRIFRAFARCVLCVRRWLGFHPVHSFNQFSALNLRWPLLTLSMPTTLMSLLVSTKPVPNEVKLSILNSLAAHCGYAAPAPAPAPAAAATSSQLLSNGMSVLKAAKRTDLMWACESGSVAEVILTWHIATGLLEQIYCPTPDMMKKTTNKEEMNTKTTTTTTSTSGSSISDNFTVATTLSRYCSYLVAFHPELLPDYQEKVENLYEAMKAELKDRLGCCPYYFSRSPTRANAIISPKGELKEKPGVVHNGAVLALWLKNPTAITTVTSAGPSPAPATASTATATITATATATATGPGPGSTTATANATEGDIDLETLWKLLAEVWTELIIYLVPSNEEERVMAHENVLWQGGEFITVLWALTTHTGITRRPPKDSSTSGDISICLVP